MSEGYIQASYGSVHGRMHPTQILASAQIYFPNGTSPWANLDAFAAKKSVKPKHYDCTLMGITLWDTQSILFVSSRLKFQQQQRKTINNTNIIHAHGVQFFSCVEQQPAGVDLDLTHIINSPKLPRQGNCLSSTKQTVTKKNVHMDYRNETRCRTSIIISRILRSTAVVLKITKCLRVPNRRFNRRPMHPKYRSPIPSTYNESFPPQTPTPCGQRTDRRDMYHLAAPFSETTRLRNRHRFSENIQSM